jgi:glycosyltransferase involved in cell wall biosynthesis
LRIHQLCARVEFGDAVSNHVLAIDRALTSWGYESDIYANTLDRFGCEVARPDAGYEAHLASAEDLLIYHYSVHCPNYRQYLATRNRRILIYHNITPPEFFTPYDTGVAEFCRLGRDLLPELAVCNLALGDSEYNRLELVGAGFSEDATGVLPIFVDFEGLLALKGRSAAPDVHGESHNVVFVGRAVPNKRIEDLIRAFFYYHHCVNPDSRLFLVGASWVDRYDAQLRWLMDSYGLMDSVVVTGRVSEPDLAAYYSAADVFLSMSEHEGFGVPLVESMAFDVPVVAYSSTAVPYTLGGAGLTFGTKDFPRVGELIEMLRIDDGVREKVLLSQKRRLKDFSPEVVTSELRSALDRVIGDGGG